ncbi:VOC family protein [Burkholderia diffusa]|uniref:VOC family protein n=1 Tax=Burkholderia diffusa TaxID=488732 RepID=UPI000AD9D43F|nr:VOC family protein [Burkholderia diffusa]
MPGLRIARPFASLARAERIYQDAFELSLLTRFHDHDGFSGARLEPEGPDRHFECTHCLAGPVAPSPAEDLIVCYLSDRLASKTACARAAAHGFLRVTSINSYGMHPEWR